MGADYIMGPPEVNNILKSIHKSLSILESQAPAQEKQQAVFDIGMQAYTLMKLINAEIQSHGPMQQKLIDLAIARCHEMGVEIRHVPSRSIYLYDFAQFEGYLTMAPHGIYAADARFALMEKAFYEHEAGDQDLPTLMLQVERKKQFLKEYPNFKKRADLEILLTLDYYELCLLYAKRKNSVKSKQFRQLTRDQCRHIVKAFPNTEAAAFATNLLAKLGI